MVLGRDWLARLKAEVVCHEKVVRISLEDGGVLPVQGESVKEKSKSPKSSKLRGL